MVRLRHLQSFRAQTGSVSCQFTWRDRTIKIVLSRFFTLWVGTEIVSHSKERAKVGGRSKTARFCVAEIQPTGSAKSVFVTSLHLNHRTEPFRLNEIDLIHQVLANALTEEDHKAGEASDRPMQIWTGDFNALTREDYNDQEWDEISAVRQQNHWESPKVALTNKVRFSILPCSRHTQVDLIFFRSN